MSDIFINSETSRPPRPGHGIICNRLLISWLERKRSNEL
jgi:hypothetical protein